ncbi:MAG: HNH endonuclease [Clostridia bacterium]|nr:HNH endonuclease [Clostridia bacterium]
MATKEQIETAWKNANAVRGKNPDVYRKDEYGNLIFKQSYGKQSKMGWEIDHKYPSSKGGTNSSRNLQALQWEENRSKGDKYPYKR